MKNTRVAGRIPIIVFGFYAAFFAYCLLWKDAFLRGGETRTVSEILSSEVQSLLDEHDLLRRFEGRE